MPGLYGFTKTHDNSLNDLEVMTSAMFLYDHFKQDTLFESDDIFSSRLHLNVIGDKNSPKESNNIYIWVEGEAYNTADACKLVNIEPESFSVSLLNAYRINGLDKFLNKIDGYFTAVIYDGNLKKVLLISDRYGLKPLYLYEKNGHLAWASHVKGIVSLSHVDKTLNNKALNCFLDIGYFLGEATWFEHIQLIKPASVVEFDLAKQKTSQRYYWQWSEIKPKNVEFELAVEQLGALLLKAVEKRFSPAESIGIPISGGLDSRCLFAAVRELYPEFKGFAFTFGKMDCDDVVIAKKVMSGSGWAYQTFLLTKDNWFKPRFKKVEDTDGLKDILHMHGSEFLPQIKDKMSISLNGYLGDAVLGGSYLNILDLMDTKIDRALVQKLYGHHIDEIDFNFYDINHIDPFLYMNRARRLINAGSINSLSFVEQRKPFFDNDIMEFVFSLPDSYRKNNLIYSQALLKVFPKYFKTIPWQNTGNTIDKLFTKPSFLKRAFNKIKRELLATMGIKDVKNFTDYPNWIREDDVSSQLSQLLKYKGSIYSQYTNIDFYKQYLEPHLKFRYIDNSKMILRACTFVIYLNSLKNDGVEPLITKKDI